MDTTAALDAIQGTIQNVDPTELLQDFGPAGITLGIVAFLRTRLSLTSTGTIVAAVTVALVSTLAVDMYDGAVAWHRLPFDTLKTWLMSMGAWSGGKHAAGK
jgi:hypothetical protein